MSNRPTGIDAPGMRDTLTVQDADTRKEKVVRVRDLVGIYDSYSEIRSDVTGPSWLANGDQYFATKSGLILPLSQAVKSEVTQRRYATAAPITSVRYIDPDRSANGTGTIEDPLQWSQIPDGQALTDHRAYLIKRGTEFGKTITLGGTKTNVIFGAYGEGAAPIWNADTTHCIDPVFYTNSALFGIDFRSQGDWVIKNTNGTSTVNRGLQILGCKIALDKLAASNAALRLHGANNKVLFCIIDRIANDALWTNANGLEVAYSYIDNVGLYTGVAEGDCIQLAETATGAHLHHNFLRNMSGAKQVIEGAVTTAGVDFLIEDNVIIHGGAYPVHEDTKAIKTKHSNTIVRRNYIEAVDAGVWLENSGTVTDNMILHKGWLDNTGNAAIHPVLSGGTYKIQRNLLVAQNVRPKFGIRYGYATAMGAGSVISDNVAVGFEVGLRSLNQTVYTETGNQFYDCLVAYDDGTNPVALHSSSSSSRFDPFLVGRSAIDTLNNNMLRTPLDKTGSLLLDKLTKLKIDFDAASSEFVFNFS